MCVVIFINNLHPKLTLADTLSDTYLRRICFQSLNINWLPCVLKKFPKRVSWQCLFPIMYDAMKDRRKWVHIFPTPSSEPQILIWRSRWCTVKLSAKLNIQIPKFHWAWRWCLGEDWYSVESLSMLWF